MLKSVFRTTQFKKDFKVLLKKHYSPDKLKQAIDALMAQNKQLLSTKIPRPSADWKLERISRNPYRG